MYGAQATINNSNTVHGRWSIPTSLRKTDEREYVGGGGVGERSTEVEKKEEEVLGKDVTRKRNSTASEGTAI